jgi:hypothetical protein
MLWEAVGLHQLTQTSIAAHLQAKGTHSQKPFDESSLVASLSKK